MIRKLLLPALLAGLLGGCVSAGYSYRDGYYYGQPSVEYRYHGYGYGYGYPYGYGYYPYGYYNYYGYPYRYGYGYGYPYYGYSPYRHHHHHHRRPTVDGTPRPRPPRDDDSDGDNPPPWRDPNRRRRMGEVAGGALEAQGIIRPQPQPATREAPRRETRNDGSRTGQTAPTTQRTQEPRRRQSGNVHEPR
ncbi:hypothetical protein ACFPOA_12940 [Lysobacter niabensis]|uniref:hypothetical protein n=1 Tax=Agrilutibacter niabensis TaxID=380628 RepID=UPI003609A5CD